MFFSWHPPLAVKLGKSGFAELEGCSHAVTHDTLYSAGARVWSNPRTCFEVRRSAVNSAWRMWFTLCSPDGKLGKDLGARYRIRLLASIFTSSGDASILGKSNG